MVEPIVTRLHPGPVEAVPLAGLYLAESLRERRIDDRALVYTDFVVSVDGRVAVGEDEDGPAHGVPASLANPRDWRLYQELALQADVVIVGGRYVREHAQGIAGPIITVDDDPDMEDLAAWRDRQGLSPRPALAIISRTLDFDAHDAAALADDVVAIGSAAADPDRVAQLEALGMTVVLGVSEERVTGTEIAEGLSGLGYRAAFSAAGPRLAHLLIEDGVLDLLFVTQVMKLLGGSSYVTLAEGTRFAIPPTMDLRSLYLDRGDTGEAAQLYAVLELQR